MKAPEHLEAGATTYRKRNLSYGDSYHRFGQIMTVLFPNPLIIAGVKNWNRLGVLSMMVTKLVRYTKDFSEPHEDSMHDLMVYASMLSELDQEEPK